MLFREERLHVVNLYHLLCFHALEAHKRPPYLTGAHPAHRLYENCGEHVKLPVDAKRVVVVARDRRLALASLGGEWALAAHNLPHTSCHGGAKCELVGTSQGLLWNKRYASGP